MLHQFVERDFQAAEPGAAAAAEPGAAEPGAAEPGAAAAAEPGAAAAAEPGYDDDIALVTNAVIQPILNALQELEDFLQPYYGQRVLDSIDNQCEAIREFLNHFEFQHAAKLYFGTIAHSKTKLTEDIEEELNSLSQETLVFIGEREEDDKVHEEIESEIAEKRQELKTVVGMFEKFWHQYDNVMKLALESSVENRIASKCETLDTIDKVTAIANYLKRKKKRRKRKEKKAAVAKAAATRSQAREDEARERNESKREKEAAAAKAAANGKHAREDDEGELEERINNRARKHMERAQKNIYTKKQAAAESDDAGAQAVDIIAMKRAAAVDEDAGAAAAAVETDPTADEETAAVETDEEDEEPTLPNPPMSDEKPTLPNPPMSDEDSEDSEDEDGDEEEKEMDPAEEEEDASEFENMKKKYKAANDCLHSFGDNDYFDNDGENFARLRQYEKKMDAILRKALKAARQTENKIEKLQKQIGQMEAKKGGEESKNSDIGDLTTEIDRLQEQLKTQQEEVQDASDNATLDPSLAFDPAYSKMSDMKLIDDKRFDQLRIRKWAYAALASQMRTGTIFEIQTEGEDGQLSWHFGRVTNPRLEYEGRYCVEYECVVRVGHHGHYRYKLCNEADTLFVFEPPLDTFRRVDRTDAAFEPEAEEAEEDEAFDADAADDSSFGIGDNVEYVDGDGNIIRGVIHEKQRQVNPLYPYEYKLKGGDDWISGERLHESDDTYTDGDGKAYGAGDVITWRGAKHKISEFKGGVLHFENGQSVTFDDIADADAKQADASADTEETARVKEDEELDMSAKYTYNKRKVTIVTPPRLLYPTEEWEKLKRDNKLPEDLPQPEMVKVKDCDTGDEFEVDASQLEVCRD